MPWMLRVKEEEVAEAVDRGTTWREVLDALGYLHGSSQRPSRCARFSYSYTDDELRDAVVASFSWAEVLRRLGYCPTGGNWKP